jgi:hypothetical protein
MCGDPLDPVFRCETPSFSHRPAIRFTRRDREGNASDATKENVSRRFERLCFES